MIIHCFEWASLNSTNVIVPDSVIKDVVEVNIEFFATGITQLTNPILNSQLAKLVTDLTISENKISKIDAKVFDSLPKLEELTLLNNGIDDKVLNSGFVVIISRKRESHSRWLTPSIGKTLKSFQISYNNVSKVFLFKITNK